MTPLISIRNIDKSFFGAPALRSVSFDIIPNRILGLIGENGAGKSTLMNILCGELQPDSGELYFRGRPFRLEGPAAAAEAGIALIHQELNLFNNLSIADNLFLSRYPRRGPWIDKGAMHDKALQLLHQVGLDLPPNWLLERLRPGERQLVEICKALHADAELVIFDEPTTSLTAAEKERLFQVIDGLKQRGKTIIYISHDLDEVMRLCDDIVVLRDGRMVDFGAASEFTLQRMIASMCGCELEYLFPIRQGTPQAQVLLEVRHLSAEGLVEDVSFEIRKGEILGLFGLMGSGRTELARLLFGLEPFDSGRIVFNGRILEQPSPRRCIELGMAFVTENRREEGLLIDGTVQDNLVLATLNRFVDFARFLDAEKMASESEAQVRQLNLRCTSLKQIVKSLSGGNQQKVVLGKWLLARPLLFILDEPTRGIDVGAKYEVYSLINHLADEGAGILMISSELEELTALCDRLLVIHRGEIIKSFTKDQFDAEKILEAAFHL
ncbi:MAG: sugar ABC transporter ATP-binding protein [candidate division KSB1 bacterium]|nr:sugar ABC transporter ATP-binding protein [candidate division KSB1 bacterium]